MRKLETILRILFISDQADYFARSAKHVFNQMSV
jgi:hypothetical protein